MFKQSLAALCTSLTGLLVLASAPALAQSSSDKVNDFFGASPNAQITPPASSSSSSSSTASPSASPSSGLVPAPTGNGASPTDFTADEKRMQKKNKAMVKHIQSLIEEGDRMMKAGLAKKDDKMYKKGKIKKEIGERNQADMKASAAQAEAAKNADKADGT
ncbi:MAG: hypothetical protein KGS72_09870 [Cyanobacteria bacterium REEB67]|nr:hypothetical protein [Cyanobacteria bacterium REEB67]